GSSGPRTAFPSVPRRAALRDRSARSAEASGAIAPARSCTTAARSGSRPAARSAAPREYLLRRERRRLREHPVGLLDEPNRPKGERDVPSRAEEGHRLVGAPQGDQRPSRSEEGMAPFEDVVVGLPDRARAAVVLERGGRVALPLRNRGAEG